MKSGDIATPVDTPNAEVPRLEAEIKRLEEESTRAISQVDKEQIARDIDAAKVALEYANKQDENVKKLVDQTLEELKGMDDEVVEATKMPMSAPIKKPVKKTTSTKKKKKTKNK